MTLALAALLGGLGLFLLGTGMMTEGLKTAAGEALRDILQRWTRTPMRGLAAGFLITALVRSSSAVTVAAIGFVNAGLLSLPQAVWVVFGTNIGTTTTAWLVAFIGIRFDIGALALPLLGLGMLVRLLAAGRPRLSGGGQALAGFGCFFLGVEVLQDGFAGLAPHVLDLGLPETGLWAVLAFTLLGVALTVLTQSSSAAIAIALTASAGGALPLEMGAAVVVGTNVGTTSTALLASIGATPAARRVAVAHIAFNLLTGAAALMLLGPLVAASAWLPRVLAGTDDMPTVLAVFHTLFNLLGVLLMWPLAAPMIRWLAGRFTAPSELLARPKHLDDNLLVVPELAVQGLAREIARLLRMSAEVACGRIRGIHPPVGEATVLALGGTVRGFLGRLNARPLPPATVAALPGLLRAVQHAEALALMAEKLHETAPGAVRLARHGPWEELRGAALEALIPVAGDPETAARDAEAAYQATKRALLAAASADAGAIGVVDQALLHAQRLRHMAHAAVKARRRLRPLLQAGPAAQDQEPTMPDAQDMLPHEDPAKPGDARP